MNRYLLLPFFLADIFGRIQENRKANLALSKTYYDEFIKLCNHYELVTKEVRMSSINYNTELPLAKKEMENCLR